VGTVVLRLLCALAAIAGPAHAEGTEADLEAARDFADALSGTARPAPKQLRINTVVTFGPGTARVYSAGRERIAELARSWRTQPAWTVITVEGYSGTAGLALGQIRADRVRGYLIRYGVDPEYVVAVARGSTKGPASRVDLAIALCDGCRALR
jgi:outer membrane protein OmpA-like peptidoglycan-associated protein